MTGVKAAHPRVSFADLEQWPEDGRRYELYDGEVYVVLEEPLLGACEQPNRQSLVLMKPVSRFRFPIQDDGNRSGFAFSQDRVHQEPLAVG